MKTTRECSQGKGLVTDFALILHTKALHAALCIRSITSEQEKKQE